MVVLMIAGKAGSGKDTSADYIVSKYRYKKFAFGTNLKFHVSLEYGIPIETLNNQIGKTSLYSKDTTVRDILIKEANIKRKGNYDYWANLLLEDIGEHDNNIVISDFRYPNEYFKMRERFRVRTVYIQRDDVHLIDDPSETSLDDFRFDYTVYNNGNLHELYKQLDEIMLTKKYQLTNIHDI